MYSVKYAYLLSQLSCACNEDKMSFTDWSFDKVIHDPELFLTVYTT